MNIISNDARNAVFTTQDIVKYTGRPIGTINYVIRTRPGFPVPIGFVMIEHKRFTRAAKCFNKYEVIEYFNKNKFSSDLKKEYKDGLKRPPKKVSYFDCNSEQQPVPEFPLKAVKLNNQARIFYEYQRQAKSNTSSAGNRGVL